MIGQVPELEELLSIPAEALQKELCLSREEVLKLGHIFDPDNDLNPSSDL